MPTYEYECEKCACRFELNRRFSDDAGSPRCPKCQGNVRQIFSPSAILFKGSGFYVTDSLNDRNRPSEEGKADKVEGSKQEEGKTDKVQSGKKEEGKADKGESSRKEESKDRKLDSGKKVEGKIGKVQSGQKEESK